MQIWRFNPPAANLRGLADLRGLIFGCLTGVHLTKCTQSNSTALKGFPRFGPPFIPAKLKIAPAAPAPGLLGFCPDIMPTPALSNPAARKIGRAFPRQKHPQNPRKHAKTRITTLSVAVLAGGHSSRMRVDKASLLLAGKSLLAHVLDAAVALDAPVRIIRNDLVDSCGPLGGIYTGLKQASSDYVLFLPCDMPFVTPAFLERVAAAAIRTGRPVFAHHEGRAGFPCVIPKKMASLVKRQIAGEQFSLQKLAEAAGAERVTPGSTVELMNLNTPEDYREAQRLTRGVVAPVLAVSALSIRRGKTQLVSDFSWSLRPGEHWVILGANGSGKTSLLSAMLGYLTPTAGEIAVLGEVYGDSDWRSLRSKIGLVSSSIRQIMAETEPAWITVASGRYAMVDFWGTPGKADRAAAHQILALTECEHIADRPWGVLSQGERQRVLIGRALMARPALLILDEPCAGLDPAAREHFLNFLERLGREKNAPALVLVTHHVEEIMPVFTHGLLLKSGRKLAEGPIPKIVTSKNLSAAFSADARLRKVEGRYHLRVKGNPRVII